MHLPTIEGGRARRSYRKKKKRVVRPVYRSHAHAGAFFSNLLTFEGGFSYDHGLTSLSRLAAGL